MTHNESAGPLTTVQASDMLTLQAEMNHKIDSFLEEDNRKRHVPHLRFVIFESARVVEHHGWKWFAKKHTLTDLELQASVVNIWHFLLSWILQINNYNQENALDTLIDKLGSLTDCNRFFFDNQTWRLDQLDMFSKFELMIGLAAVRRYDLNLFTSILRDCGMNWLDLYRRSVGKNVLNAFRHDSGYHDDLYKKDWQGRDDTEILSEILDAADPNRSDFQLHVYSELEKRYPG